LKIRLGFVGAGPRGQRVMSCCYEVRDRLYLYGGGPGGHPYDVYAEHAEDAPGWAEDVSDLAPEVTAILDPYEAAREQSLELCRERGDLPRTFGSLEEFLAFGEYDAVVVSSPNARHLESVLLLLEKGVHLLCEKPVATSLEEHDLVIEAAGASEALFYAGFNLRSAPFFRRVKELVEGGAIGRLGMVACREVRDPLRRGFRYDRRLSGGSILEKVCHDFDLFNWYCGADPVRVSAFGGRHVFARGNDTADQATVIVEYGNGSLGTLELCLYAPFGQRTRTYELRGSGGVLRSPEEEETIELFTHHGRERYGVGTGGIGGHYGGDFLQMRSFLRCLQGKEEPPGTLLDAKKAAAVALAAERSAVEREVVSIDSRYGLS
jgi:myo-inositol 2-dehydrogenase/D-chiro-inositol 1-dehydrogenase